MLVLILSNEAAIVSHDASDVAPQLMSTESGVTDTSAERGVDDCSPPATSSTDYVPPSQSAITELERIRTEMRDIFGRAAKRFAAGDLGLIGWGPPPRVHQIHPDHHGKTWYFVGDIHGDFLAWHVLFETVRRDPDFRLCFLGDLVDRGPMDIECVAAILDAAERYPQQILWIVGNHDEAIRFTPGAERPFSATVEPAEFTDWLNAPTNGIGADDARSWGHLFIAICNYLPRAARFPDGLLATHGGIPLADRWPHLTTILAFEQDGVLSDFTWTRATSAPKKLGWKFDPARRATSSSFEFGYKDLEGFSAAVSAVLPITEVIRGHDHVDGGYERPSGYGAIPLHTLNAFGFNHLTNSLANYKHELPLGVRRAGSPLEITRVTYSMDEYQTLYMPIVAPATDIVPTSEENVVIDESGGGYRNGLPSTLAE